LAAISSRFKITYLDLASFRICSYRTSPSIAANQASNGRKFLARSPARGQQKGAKGVLMNRVEATPNASMDGKNNLEFQPQHTNREDGEMDWKKTLMIGSFAAGAILFLTGRRPAGLAIAGIGVATFAAEHPEKFEELWQRMPEYIEKGSKFVDMASTFLERMGQEKGGYRNMPVAGGTRF
jgi:hypothetical protein